MLWLGLQASEQELNAPVRLAEVHVTEAQVMEDVRPWDLLLAPMDNIRNRQIV